MGDALALLSLTLQACRFPNHALEGFGQELAVPTGVRDATYSTQARPCCTDHRPRHRCSTVRLFRKTSSQEESCNTRGSHLHHLGSHTLPHDTASIHIRTLLIKPLQTIGIKRNSCSHRSYREQRCMVCESSFYFSSGNAYMAAAT